MSLLVIGLGIGFVFGGYAHLKWKTYQEAKELKKRGKISWLDYMQIRDLMAHGNNYEAAVLTLKKGYDMNEDEMKKLTPERFHQLMMNLRTDKQEGVA